MATLEERMARLRQSAGQEGPTRNLADRMQAVQDYAQRPITVGEASQRVFGFDESLRDRGTFVPLAETEPGQGMFGTNITPAVPGFLKSMLESSLVPGVATMGGTGVGEPQRPGAVTPEESTSFALDFLMPGTLGPRRPRQDVQTSIRETAPSPEQLRQDARRIYSGLEDRGVVASADSYTDLLGEMETFARNRRINPTMHPRSNAMLNELTKEVGKSPDLGSLEMTRRQLTRAANTVDPDLAEDRDLAGIMRDMLDDFVDNLDDTQVVAGDATGAGEQFRAARDLWKRASKVDDIDAIMEAARNQASGFENGIRIGFRKLANNTKAMRRYSDSEKEMINDIAQGKDVNLWRFLSSFGPRPDARSMMGTTIGTAGGASAGSAFGPIGAAVGAIGVPAMGRTAGAVARRKAQRSAQNLQALAATGRGLPGEQAERRFLMDLVTRALLPGARAQQNPAGVQPYDPNIL